ncbi:MAG: 50S ribosomal protein L11 methyltransferase [Paracoccaceae bacterium]
MHHPLVEPVPLDPEGTDFPPGIRDEAMRLLAAPDGYDAVAELLKQSMCDYPLADLAQAAIALRAAAPTRRNVWAVTDDLVYSQVPDWHWKMLRDRMRTRAYHDAIRANVMPGMQVLEIGAGTCVLAMMAAEAGAEHVWTVEVNPLLARIAEQCIARNGFTDRITVLNMHSSQVIPGRDLPCRAELLVHEILCRSALTEGLAPTLHHAQEELLVPGAALLPEFIGLEAVLCGDVIAGDAPWWQVEEFDLSPLALLDAAAHQVPEASPHHRLSLPVGVAEIDLRGEDLMTPRRCSGPLEAHRPGTVAGVEQWMKICFPGGTVLSSDDRTSSWGTCYHPFGAIREVEPGDRVDVEVSLGIDVISIGLAAKA